MAVGPAEVAADCLECVWGGAPLPVRHMLCLRGVPYRDGQRIEPPLRVRYTMCVHAYVYNVTICITRTV